MAGTYDDARLARARSSISLGAAFALFFTVLLGYDAPASRASGGLIDALFGPPRPPALLVYDADDGPPMRMGARPDRPRHMRQATHQRARNAQARRRVTERRRYVLNRQEFAAAHARRPGPADNVAPPERSVSRPAEGAAVADRRRAVCVRACDGYAFPALPVSRAADIPAREASCQTLCPGGQASLFVLPRGSDDLARATSAQNGLTYAQLRARLDPGDEKAKACACQTTGAVASAALLADATLRPGDTVVTSAGLRVVRRGSRYPFKSTDFLSLAETDPPLSHRSALYAIERALATPRGARPPETVPERRRP